MNKFKETMDIETAGDAAKKTVKSKKARDTGESVIHEIDSWRFTFSHDDNCICLGTPALQSFRLKLTTDMLEELLEFMYQKTGKEKTTRKLRLSPEEIPELIDTVSSMIEEKRSKIPVNFDSDELENIVELINIKLKQ
jgi:hypothetical protein